MRGDASRTMSPEMAHRQSPTVVGSWSDLPGDTWRTLTAASTENRLNKPQWTFLTTTGSSMILLDKLGVTGSSPVPPTRRKPRTRGAFRFSGRETLRRPRPQNVRSDPSSSTGASEWQSVRTLASPSEQVA
jgi:hypothetical protein